MIHCPCCDESVADGARRCPQCGTILTLNYRPSETTLESDRPSRMLYLKAKGALEAHILKYPGRYTPFSRKSMNYDLVVHILDNDDIERFLILSIAQERNLRSIDPLKIDKNIATAYNEIGLCRRLRCDFQGAERYLRKGIESLSSHSSNDEEIRQGLLRAYHDLAEALFFQNKFQEALHYMESRLSLLKSFREKDEVNNTKKLVDLIKSKSGKELQGLEDRKEPQETQKYIQSIDREDIGKESRAKTIINNIAISISGILLIIAMGFATFSPDVQERIRIKKPIEIGIFESPPPGRPPYPDAPVKLGRFQTGVALKGNLPLSEKNNFIIVFVRAKGTEWIVKATIAQDSGTGGFSVQKTGPILKDAAIYSPDSGTFSIHVHLRIPGASLWQMRNRTIAIVAATGSEPDDTYKILHPGMTLTQLPSRLNYSRVIVVESYNSIPLEQD